MSELRLQGVGKEMADRPVLQDVSLTVAAGELVVVVGPSGSGKSTLLRAIAGLTTLNRGEIWLGDRRIDGVPPKDRDIAMVFQSYALYPHLTVADNLAFGLRRRRLPGWRRWDVFSAKARQERRAIDHRVREVADLLQLAPLLQRKPGQLSGGQQQRVALGRAIARNPQLFLWDEPLSNLDPQLRQETRGQLVRLQRQVGVTTLYVTHDRTEAMAMGDRVAVLSEGRLQQVAPPLDLYWRPANRVAASFAGSMNFLPVVWRDGCVHGPHLHQPMAIAAAVPPQQPLWLGLRPEHLVPGDRETAPLVGPIVSQEALGHETDVVCRLAGGHEGDILLTVRLYGQNPPGTEGAWHPQHLYLFDAQTEALLWSA
ncbi:MAG: ABC transporter ATP-binding protein [Pseudanabaenaceae cyanobacterium]